MTISLLFMLIWIVLGIISIVAKVKNLFWASNLGLRSKRTFFVHFIFALLVYQVVELDSSKGFSWESDEYTIFGFLFCSLAKALRLLMFVFWDSWLLGMLFRSFLAGSWRSIKELFLTFNKGVFLGHRFETGIFQCVIHVHRFCPVMAGKIGVIKFAEITSIFLQRDLLRWY